MPHLSSSVAFFISRHGQTVSLSDSPSNRLPAPVGSGHSTQSYKGGCVLAGEPKPVARQTFTHIYDVPVTIFQSCLEVGVAPVAGQLVL